ncbi:MAG TPA: VapE family protein [Rhodoferax sp.]|jgi:hypothetical protein|nr:VapE domain-containing protein [Rhodoferax sp.]HPW27995.1 VapE family protein [Rhodoferax sp.]
MGLMDEAKRIAAGDTAVAPIAVIPVKTVGVLQPKPTPSKDNLEQFYQVVLPASGKYCLFQTSNRHHSWCDSISELVDKTIALGDKPDIYFATGTFVEPNARTQANAALKKAFYFDLDAGTKKLETQGPEKVYATQQDAIHGIVEFARETGLVPSLFVSSGEGLHLYWVLDEAIPAAQWTAIARQFQKFGVSKGLKIDSSVTADSARILRPIGTLHPNGKRVTILKDTGKTYTAEAFANVIGADALALPATASKYDLSINDEVLASPNYADRTYDIGLIRAQCNAVKFGIENPMKLEEPYWRLMMGIAKHTVNGRAAAHDLSKTHPKYSANQTNDYFDRWATGPSTCGKFAEFNPTACAGCKHKGTIKSPIVLGQILESTGEVMAPPSVSLLKATLPDWNYNKEGVKTKPQNTSSNVAALARSFGYQIRYNVMSKRTETTISGNVVPRDDLENANLVFLGDSCVRAGMARNGLADLVDAIAGSNAYHPAKDWIDSIPWDNTSRIADFHNTLELIDPQHNNLRDKLLDAFMLQAIGALELPGGIAAQGILVVAGLQDIQKTRYVKSLCPVPGAVREGLHLDPLNKDSVLQATNSWISELGELDSTTRKSDIAALKAFITRDEDVLRPAYARRENVYRRRTVFIGSVNGTGFLVDETGDRRFWTLAVRFCHLLPAEVMQQIWAEYMVRFKSGARWYLDATTKAELSASNADHRAVDPIRERITTRFDWRAIDWSSVDVKVNKNRPDIEWLTATDVCNRIGLDRPTKSDATRAGTIVRELNRVTIRKSNGIQLLGVPCVKRSI